MHIDKAYCRVACNPAHFFVLNDSEIGNTEGEKISKCKAEQRKRLDLYAAYLMMYKKICKTKVTLKKKTQKNPMVYISPYFWIAVRECDWREESYIAFTHKNAYTPCNLEKLFYRNTL